MQESIKYRCEVCGRKVEASVKEFPPKCCDRSMQPEAALPQCELSTTAEHSRLDGDDEPCDDGRSGTS